MTTHGAIWKSEMLMPRTLFVVGAGASREVGLSTGDKLKEKVANELTFESDGFTAMAQGPVADSMKYHSKTSGKSFSDYLESAKDFRSAVPLASTIDYYLDSKRDSAEHVFCGKMAIWKILLEEEERSVLRPKNELKRVHFDSIKKTWYVRLFRIMNAGVKAEDIFENCAFITFNYDRCIEQAFSEAVAVY